MITEFKIFERYDAQERLYNQQKTEWFSAFEDGDIDKLEELIENGFPIDAETNWGETLLQLALFKDNSEMIDFCIDNDADIHIKNSDGESVLHIVDTDENYIKYFIENGVDINNISNEGLTPLMLAAYEITKHFNNSKKVKILLDLGAEWDIKDKDGETFLDLLEFSEKGKELKEKLPKTKEEYFLNKDLDKFKI